MIKCLIIAEHQEEAELVTKIVKAFDFFSIVPAKKNNGNSKQKNKLPLPDVVILEGSNLLEKDLKQIKNSGNNPFTIVITSSPGLAAKAYELGIEDFILKPLKKDRLIHSLSAAKKRLFPDVNQGKEIINNGFFFIKEKDSLKKIKWDEVLYFQALGDYINLFTQNKKITLHSNLKHLASFLPEEKFVRIHRSYIINISKVDRITGNNAHLNANSIPIGDAFRSKFISLLKVFK